MPKTSITINRAPSAVWEYFTDSTTWDEWYGGGIEQVDPAWESGARIIWKFGEPSTLESVLAGREVVVAGSFMKTWYRFIPQGDEATCVEVEFTPRGGAVFTDGGQAKLADTRTVLARLKQLVEKKYEAPPKPMPVPATPVKEDEVDYSYVKDKDGNVCGIWLRDSNKAQNRTLLGMLLTKDNLPKYLSMKVMEGRYRVVPNTRDKAGGCYVMFGDAPAPGEKTGSKRWTVLVAGCLMGILVILGCVILGIGLWSRRDKILLKEMTTTPAPTPTNSLPEPGYWITTPGEFGQISFLVNNDSTIITEIKFTISDWSCGDRQPNAYTGADEQYPIEDGRFAIIMNILPSGENIFDSMSKTGTLTFVGSFEGGSKASGTWEFDFSDTGGEKCVGTWNAERNPAMTGSAPVSTQVINTQSPDQLLPNEVEAQATKLEDITGIWLETFPGGSAHLEIRPDGSTNFEIISGSNKGYKDQGQYWFENGELSIKTEGIAEIGRYKVYVTRRDGKSVSIRYEVIEDSYGARRDAMIYAPLTLVEAVASTESESTLQPLDILGCNPVSECPETAVSIRSFFEENEELLYNTEYPVSVSLDTEVRFFTGWCTSEQEILEENLKQIEFVFTVDGVSFIEILKPNTYTVQDQTDSTKLNYCHSVGGVISGWQQDQIYRIVFGMKLKATISDGWDTYGPGNNTRIYLISTSAEISDSNQPLDGGNWQPATFTIPPGNGYWDQPSENSYNAIGLKDTFIWTEEVYEGDLTLSYDIEILYGNGEWGGGAVILFGDGTGWSKGNLIFFVNGEAQNIQLDTIYDGTVFLAYNTLTLQDNHTYSLTIEILGKKASLFLDGEEIVSATLPTRVNRSGQIGLFKEWAVPEVTFSNIKVKVPSQ